MPNGYWDRILHIDLTARTTWTESLGDAWWRRHLGGRALIAHYLLKEVPVGADPLVRVAQAGVGAEHGVKFALVVNDLNEVAGRTGTGAVMAAKNLKAIAVRGTQKVPVADGKPLQ